MARKGVPFGKIADFIRALDKVATDGSSRGSLAIKGDFIEMGNGEWGFSGGAALSEELAALSRLAPAELKLEIERMKEWVGSHAVELEWLFGKADA